MNVFVIGLTGKRLMPTKPSKARKLINTGKAEIYTYKPFTIRLLYKTGSATQNINLGIDTGSQHIGVGITSDQQVMYKAEIELRSSMEKRSLMERRASYRRGRRYRKVRFRCPKWKCKTIRKYHKEPDKKGRHWQKESHNFMSDRKEGWLPPSIQSKTAHHIEWIKRYLNSLPDNTKLVIEVARFDMARMKNPDIHGELYQKGPQYDYENVKAYVFDRDGYKCRICNTKAGTKRKDGTVVKMHAHHTLYKSKGATDNPDYMATVCDCCHSAENHAPGGILYQWMVEEKKFARGYRDATFMNILRKRLYEEFPNAIFTYGNITTADRKRLKLDKSHANDAVAVSLVSMDITLVKDISNAVYIKQVRQKSVVFMKPCHGKDAMERKI